MSARLLIATALALALLAPAAARADDGDHGAPIPNYSKKIGDARYRSSLDWKETLAWYRKRFAGTNIVTYKTIINQPGKRAIHIKNTQAKRRWDGINLYEWGREIRLFVLPSAAELERVKKEAEEKAKKKSPGKRTK